VNLVRNAVESMQLNSGVPGELEIRVDEADAMVLTTVADRGHGLIDSNKVFDPFFTTKDEGMGMGLRICKTIIEAHDGKLWAASRPDGGAAFTFSLPINIR
jgi:signal transduction histidine kinase